KGYLEDRRPNSQGDPYQIASQVLKTIASVPTEAGVAAAAARSPRFNFVPRLLGTLNSLPASL
ncbi:MAG: hypothetical protein JSR92_07995, partial [Proteobacteria bacterium]|nr:hypothetical protein [Pseudomonadota bacterium]